MHCVSGSASYIQAEPREQDIPSQSLETTTTVLFRARREIIF
jgi:hypothetical protein